MKVAIIDTERGTNRAVSQDIESGRVVVYPASSAVSLGTAMDSIKNQLDDLSHIVLDTIGTLTTSLTNEILKRGGGSSQIWANPNAILTLTQQQWGQMSSRVILFLRDLQELGKPVIVVCHEGERENPYEGTIMHGPDLNKSLLKELYGMNDAIVRLGKLSGKTKINGVEYQTGTRVLRMIDSPQFMAKGGENSQVELLPEPTLAKIAEMVRPFPQRMVLYGPPGAGKTWLAGSPLSPTTTSKTKGKSNA